MITGAWILGAAVITWTQGFSLNPPQFPAPYKFLDLSIVMLIAAALQRLNPMVGGVFAWGMLLALMIRGYATPSGQQRSFFQDVADLMDALTKAQQGTGVTGAGGTGTPSGRTATPPGVPNPGGGP